MKQLKTILLEKLIINANTHIRKFTDEELVNDYKAVWDSFSISEKKPYKEKYGVHSNKKEDIMKVILDRLRENRNKKKEFEVQDLTNFFRYDIPENYPKFKTYREMESKEFIEYMLEKYKEKLLTKSIHSSIYKHTQKRIKQIEIYLDSIK